MPPIFLNLLFTGCSFTWNICETIGFQLDVNTSVHAPKSYVDSVHLIDVH